MTNTPNRFNFIIGIYGFVICLFMLAIGIYELFTIKEQFIPAFTYAHLSMIFVFLLIASYAIFQYRTPFSTIFSDFNGKELILYVLTLSCGALCLYYENSMRSIRLDEFTQFFNILQETYSISRYAAESQQTPMDYYFGLFAGTLFDLELISYRLFPCLFFILTIAFINFFTREVGIGLSLRFLIPLLYVSFPLISYQSVEARPIYLVMHFAVVFLATVYIFLQKRSWSWPIFSLVAFLFTFSAGLQPIMIFFIFMFYLLVTGLLSFRSEKKIIASFVFVSVLGLANSLYIRHVSLPMNQFHSNWLDKFSLYLERLNYEHLEPYFRSFNPYVLLFPVLLVGTLLFLKKLKGPSLRFCLALILSIISFTVIYDTFYYTYINWFPIVDRYVIVVPLFGFFLFAIIAKDLVSIANKKLVTQGINLVLGFSIVLSTVRHEAYVEHYRIHESLPTREIYEDIKRLMTDQSGAQMMVPRSIKTNQLSLWIAPRVYLNKKEFSYLSKYSNVLHDISHYQLVLDKDDLENRRVNKFILVLFQEADGSVFTFLRERYPDSWVDPSDNRYTLFQFELKPEDPTGSIVELFKQVVENTEAQFSFSFFKVILHYALVREDIDLIDYVADYYTRDHFWVDKDEPMAIDENAYKDLKAKALEALRLRKEELMGLANE